MSTETDNRTNEQRPTAQSLSQREKLDLRLNQLISRSRPGAIINMTLVVGKKNDLTGWHVNSVQELEG